MFKVKPWMLGVGVCGVAGVGIAIYEVMHKKAAAASPAALPIAATGPGAVAVPSVTPSRPDSTVNNVFSANGPPPGPILAINPGAMSAALASGASVTLMLPIGCTWVGGAIGNSANPNVALATINFAGNMTSPIALSTSQLVGANTIVTTWKDLSGKTQMTVVSLPLVVSIKPLTLHL